MAIEFEAKTVMAALKDGWRMNSKPYSLTKDFAPGQSATVYPNGTWTVSSNGRSAGADADSVVEAMLQVEEQLT